MIIGQPIRPVPKPADVKETPRQAVTLFDYNVGDSFKKVHSDFQEHPFINIKNAVSVVAGSTLLAGAQFAGSQAMPGINAALGIGHLAAGLAEGSMALLDGDKKLGTLALGDLLTAGGHIASCSLGGPIAWTALLAGNAVTAVAARWQDPPSRASFDW